MMNTISNPLALIQLLEQKIRNTSLFPIDFKDDDNIIIGDFTIFDNKGDSYLPEDDSESNNVMTTNAILQLLQDSKMVFVKLNTYFNGDADLTYRWNNLTLTVYYLNALTLIDDPTKRESVANQILIYLRNASANISKLEGEYKDNFSRSTEGENVLESRISINVIPNTTSNLIFGNTLPFKVGGVMDAVEVLKHRNDDSYSKAGDCRHKKYESFCMRIYNGLYEAAWNMIRDEILKLENQLGKDILKRPITNLI